MQNPKNFRTISRRFCIVIGASFQDSAISGHQSTVPSAGACHQNRDQFIRDVLVLPHHRVAQFHGFPVAEERSSRVFHDTRRSSLHSHSLTRRLPPPIRQIERLPYHSPLKYSLNPDRARAFLRGVAELLHFARCRRYRVSMGYSSTIGRKFNHYLRYYYKIMLVWCREGGSNPHDHKGRQILSLLRLPVPPSRPWGRACSQSIA